MLDDMIDTAGTITNAANALKEFGAKDIYACCTHAVLSGPAIERIENSAISELIVLDTIRLPKEKEIDKQIQKLKDIKTVMQRKKAKIAFCETLQEQEIRIEECKSERLLVYPYDFSKDDISEIFSHLKDIWGIEQIRMGMGSLISLDNVYKMNFDKYEGIYTIALNKKSVPNSLIKPKGKYLCGYQKGTWDKLPALYQQMLDYANKNNLQLTGYAYEVGLNDFVISDEADYITKIVIKIQEIS